MEKLGLEQLVTIFFLFFNTVDAARATGATGATGTTRTARRARMARISAAISELSFYILNLLKSERIISDFLRHTCTCVVYLFFSRVSHKSKSDSLVSGLGVRTAHCIARI